MTRIAFRIERGRTPLAVFIDEPYDRRGTMLTVYAHVGQHCCASPAYITGETRQAKPEEFAPLAAELKSMGYDVQPVKWRGKRR